MIRYFFLIVILLLVSCGAGVEEELRVPELFAPSWELLKAGPLLDGEVPPAIQAAGLRRAVKAVYGPGQRLEVTVFEMGGQSSAFELAQQWRPEPGKLALFAGEMFVVLHAPEMDHAALGEVADALEEALKKVNE